MTIIVIVHRGELSVLLLNLSVEQVMNNGLETITVSSHNVLNQN